ncbi:nucleolar transcription factor 1-A-like isoform X2 [Chaetodon auriga]|uniref:nucleolar transcription factor 1-A-like isoform X2 n=1 Tax=Chaetodon auriga TaxID=39042 RepID=UPI0040328A7B
MSGDETGTEESGWTKANLQKLLAAMKTSIPERDRMNAYTKGLKAVDWKKVAFPPFSPEACQAKWTEMLQKMRKTRSLTELIIEAEGAISNPVRTKKVHPALPKRPSPPNAIFYEENRAKFHEKYPQMRSRKLFGLLIKKYKELPDEEKAKYVKKHQLASAEYNRRMLEFRQKKYHGSPKNESRKNRKRKSNSAGTQDGEDADGLPPKPPTNGYNLFCKEQLPSMTGVSRNSFVSVWAQRWRDLTDRQRGEYNKQCRELKSQYSIKLNEYLTTLGEEEQRRIFDKHGIKRLKASQKEGTFQGEPKTPSQCGKDIFYKDQMKLLKEKCPNSRKRLIKVNQIWKDLSKKEKGCYREKANKNILKYSMELQKWFKTLTPAEQEAYQTRHPSRCQHLDAKQMTNENLYRPSDSEDEDIEDNSSDEEEENLGWEEEEEEGDDITFEMY